VPIGLRSAMMRMVRNSQGDPDVDVREDNRAGTRPIRV
jgi:hypothetical protein